MRAIWLIILTVITAQLPSPLSAEVMTDSGPAFGKTYPVVFGDGRRGKVRLIYDEGIVYLVYAAVITESGEIVAVTPFVRLLYLDCSEEILGSCRVYEPSANRIFVPQEEEFQPLGWANGDRPPLYHAAPSPDDGLGFSERTARPFEIIAFEIRHIADGPLQFGARIGWIAFIWVAALTALRREWPRSGREALVYASFVAICAILVVLLCVPLAAVWVLFPFSVFQFALAISVSGLIVRFLAFRSA